MRLHRRQRVAGSAVAVMALLLSLHLSSASVAAARPGDDPFAATLLMEAGSGEVLAATNPHRRWPPASMTKMMLILLVLERVDGGQLSLDEPVKTSAWASRIGGSQVYLRQGEVFPLRAMMQAVAIASANDAATAVAEHLAGSTDACVTRMNQRARELGLTDTVYQSVHGLPPGRGQELDLTSATDLAMLARELIRHRDALTWASTREAPFRGGKFTLTNTNRLIGAYPGATGLKTGFHRGSGFGLTATATRGDLSLIAVVLGGHTKRAVADEAARLLTYGFSTFRVVDAVNRGRAVGGPIPVEGGDDGEVRAVAAESLRLVLKRAESSRVQIEGRVPHLVWAPVTKGQRLGELVVVNNETVLGRVELVADRDVTATSWRAWWRGWWQRLAPEPGEPVPSGRDAPSDTAAPGHAAPD